MDRAGNRQARNNHADLDQKQTAINQYSLATKPFSAAALLFLG
jgi:hypothetical protein